MTLPSTQAQDQVVTIAPTQSALDIAKDLTWVDLLKALAIIGVFFGNGVAYFLSHDLVVASLYKPTLFLRTGIGPFVQVFFILSGFGLAMGYLERNKGGWSWKRWAWRRGAKIVFPYYVFVIFSFILGIIGSILYETVNVQFSWVSLISYLTFTRNHYPPSWVWNPPLWYMPVIIGLYVIFPVLLIILRKWGPVKLLLISLFITYISLLIAFNAGKTGIHASDFFLFWTTQFAMGMILAYIRVNDAQKLRLLIGFRAILVGAALYFCSWMVTTYIPNGRVFNDSITSFGVFLIILNFGWWIRRIMPSVNKPLYSISKQSYFMYLIHYPVLSFIIGPLFHTPMHPIVVFMLVGIYILFIFFLCSFISKPITNISLKLNSVYDKRAI
jgi:peptidoglycan/LPS O-acetylase OafA/YrhL